MKRNVALVVLDAVRKDYFDQYAPRLRDLADVEYSSCRSASSWSVPSHASMFTGEVASNHGVHQYSPEYDSVSPDEFLTSSLASHRAISVTGNQWTDAPFGFDDFFDQHTYIQRDKLFPEGCELSSDSRFYGDFLKRALLSDHPVKSLINAGGKKILPKLNEHELPRLIDDGAKRIVKQSLQNTSESSEPWFLFNNFMDVHQPLRKIPHFDHSLHDAGWFYDEHFLKPQKILSDNHPQKVGDVEPQLNTCRGLYAAAVDYIDRIVSNFISRLIQESNRPTTVVITADHGEGLGFSTERRQLFHSSAMTDSLLHVPLLIVNAPEVAPSGQIDELVSHLDLSELICAVSENNWVDISRKSASAERIGSSINIDKYPWIEEEKDWWTRTIRCYYEDNEKIEWDSTGESFRFELPSSSEEEVIEREVTPSDDARSEFDSGIIECRSKAYTNDEISVESDVEENLKQLGYL